LAEPSYEQLLAENRRLKAENDRLRKRVEALEQQLQKLSEALEKSLRAEKRQAAPFSKGEPEAEPRVPGRKSGVAYGRKAHRLPPAPVQIDERYEAPLPATCPTCGGRLEETVVASQYQTEIPRKPIHREFRVHLGFCTQCGQSHQGRHPLQTSDALGAAAAQIGPDAQAATVVLNKQAGLSHGKIVRVFRDLFGIVISRGGVAQAILRAARRCQTAYQEIRASVHDSPRVVPDETGWRVNGTQHWLHVLVGDEATCYLIDRSRGAEVAAAVLGWEYSGVMTHDGCASYDRFENALHQQCVAHVLRRAHDLCQTAHGRAQCFPRQMIDLFQNALECRDLCRAGEVDPDTLAETLPEFMQELEELTCRPRQNPENDRLARHLFHHLWNWGVFLVDPEVDATNSRAEQALRGPIVNRKVWGGNRTPAGAETQSILCSVLETCRRQFLPVLDFLNQAIRGLSPTLLPKL
jgi:transposase